MAVEIKLPDEDGDQARIELTPIVDMVFLLLVFFMVGANFSNPVFELELPVAGSGGPAPKTETTISVAASGALRLNRDSIDPRELEARLRALIADDQDARVVLRSDAAARFDAVVKALDASAAAGVRNLAIEHAPARVVAGARSR